MTRRSSLLCAFLAIVSVTACRQGAPGQGAEEELQNLTVTPATSGGCSMNSSVRSVQLVTSNVGSSAPPP